MTREKVEVRCIFPDCGWTGKRFAHSLGECPRCHIAGRGNTPVERLPEVKRRKR